VTPLSPPSDAAIGERIYFDKDQPAAEPPGKKSSKIYERLAPGFSVNAEGVGTFKGIPFSTSSGPCTSTIIGRIS
jgi:aminoacyl tRNA synthase complex-interacting multifunctional protein 1